MLQKLKEIICVIVGHKYTSLYPKEAQEGKSTKERAYCKRCRQRYHKHRYVK